MEQLAKFNVQVNSSAQRFNALRPSSVLLIHHNDADGLSSGAILAASLERSGTYVRRYCLEKPYPAVLAMLLGEPPETTEAVILADFASGMLSTLQSLNVHKRPLFVLDHHMVENGAYPDITLVNCLSYGIAADPFCSASTVAALFAKSLASANADLSSLAIVGAIGDGLKGPDGQLRGLNELCAEEAIRRGEASFVGGEYFLANWPNVPVSTLVKMINALGGFGYFRGGADIAIKGLLSGKNPLCAQRALELESELQRAAEKFFRGDFLKRKGNLQWFVLDESFSKFGVKTVGLLCEQLITEGRVAADAYLAGFQTVPDEIPGLGRFPLSQVKVSMRLPQTVRSKVAAKIFPDLTQVLPDATRAVRGFVDACHPHAAATTIPSGTESQFLKCLVDATACGA